jgi:two-component system response regulator AlgR
MIKVLIADDESLARLRLQRILEKRTDVQVIGEARNGVEAVQMAHRSLPDVVLMDVCMPEMDGLEATEKIARMVPPPVVIFCTAYDDFALRAFDVRAFAYLLKPIKEEELDIALRRATQPTRAQLSDPGVTNRRYLCSKTHRGYKLVPVEQIRLLQAEQKYVVAHTPEGQSVLATTLKEIEKEFSHLFVRIHRSALVARDAIAGVGYYEGHLSVKLRDIDEEPLVSRRLEPRLRRLLPKL